MANKCCKAPHQATATPVSFYASFPSTNANSTTVSLPKFNPAIGTLSCLSFEDTVSGITTTPVKNIGSTSTIFKFLLTVADDLEGPAGGGISITNNYAKAYGPDTLTAIGNPGDTVTYGPDALIDNEIGFASTNTGLAPYLGAGNVNFTYSLSGGLVSLKGGLNYTDSIKTNYWGSFKLTYYWCPATILSTTITDFTATPSNGAVDLQWLTTNQQPNTQYEIQISKDGKGFYPVGQAEGDASATGASD